MPQHESTAEAGANNEDSKSARGLDWYKSYQLLFIKSITEFLNLVPQELILVTAPELQEDFVRYKGGKGSSNIHLYNSNLHLDLVPQG